MIAMTWRRPSWRRQGRQLCRLFANSQRLAGPSVPVPVLATHEIAPARRFDVRCRRLAPGPARLTSGKKWQRVEQTIERYGSALGTQGPDLLPGNDVRSAEYSDATSASCRARSVDPFVVTVGLENLFTIRPSQPRSDRPSKREMPISSRQNQGAPRAAT